ncbi:VRR-NUC domain-containing protein [Bacteroides clarus]|uniref:VRR-NUC domain-containing protein n=1 Tax=Bacteroides clarus TaxID=626929 RepID=UPI00189C4FCA|nr:VRR-NUC domain-containing protein [Bacteroides clarus]
MTFEEMKSKYCGANISKKHKDEEHKLQVSMMNWFRLQYPSMHHNLFAIPNGGRRDAITGKRLKEEGVLAGVSDLIFLKRNRHYGALLIETKTRKGTQRNSQKEWESKITEDGYKYVVVRSLDEFIKVVNDYLKDV